MTDARVVSPLADGGLRLVELSGDWAGGPCVRERSREMIFEVASAADVPGGG